eukprot:6223349-Amphidinium_carterae.2
MESRVHDNDLARPTAKSAPWSSTSASSSHGLPDTVEGVNLDGFTIPHLKTQLQQRGLRVRGNNLWIASGGITGAHAAMTDETWQTVSICTNDNVVSGGNATHGWRRSKDCRRMLTRTCRATGEEEVYEDVLVVTDAGEHGVVTCIDEMATTVVLDSGCKRSVAGCDWHKETHQSFLDSGIKTKKVAKQAQFRFGDDEIVPSYEAWQYPLVRGKHVIVFEFAEVASHCPALVSMDAMEFMQITIGDSA